LSNLSCAFRIVLRSSELTEKTSYLRAIGE
jgi:hypothetical protein